MMSDPYRSPPTEPQFVCIACYASLSVQPGACVHCGVDRLPLGDPEVRAEVRAEAERRLQKKLYGEWFWSYMTAATAAALFVAFPLTGGLIGGFVWVAVTLALGTLNTRIYERLAPHSALRLYADRRERFRLTGGRPQPKQLPPHVDEDPEDAELPRVLAFLGARLEK
jgi:hypothetical protein